MFALPAGTVPLVLNVDLPGRALTAALQAAGAALAAICLPRRGQATPRSVGPRYGRPSAPPSGGSSSPPGARQTRTAARPSPRGGGGFSSHPPVPGYICGTPRSATSRASPTGPARADYAERLAATGAAHERVPPGEGAPFGYVPTVLPPEGRTPPEAPAALTGLAT